MHWVQFAETYFVIYFILMILIDTCLIFYKPIEREILKDL
jgi:hypothetical protein